MGIYRTIIQILIAVVAIVLLIAFVNFMLKIALLAALLTFAYYWFMRAVKMRGSRHWKE